MIHWTDPSVWDESVSDSVTDPGDPLIVFEGAWMTERLVISPAEGKLKLEPPENFTAEGEYVLEGQVIGEILSNSGERVPVKTAFSGWVMKYFIRDGWPVHLSEPILCLRPL